MEVVIARLQRGEPVCSGVRAKDSVCMQDVYSAGKSLGAPTVQIDVRQNIGSRKIRAAATR